MAAPTQMSEPPFQLDDAGIALVQSLLDTLRTKVSWSMLSGIGAQQAPRGAKAWLRRSLGLLPPGRRQYLYPDPWRDHKLSALDRQAAFWFRFLCLNEPQSRAELEKQLGGVDAAGPFFDAGLMRNVPGGVVPMLRFLPVDGQVHLADGLLVEEDPQRFGVDHANVTNQSLMQYDHLRRELTRRAARSLLEMGCGTGFVSLALRNQIPQRDGADLSARAVEIARANAVLSGDSQASYLESNLFSAVEGRYDLILFNPWQDGESVAELVLPFLQTAPDHLNPGGRIVMFLNTLEPERESPLLASIHDWMQQQKYQARRSVMMSYCADDQRMHALSMLWLEPGAPPQLQTRKDQRWLGLRLKSMLYRR